LGEGPAVSGHQNNLVTWVDIYQKKVLSKDLESGVIGEFSLPSLDKEITFAIPRSRGGQILGVTGGPFLCDPDGTLTSLGLWEQAFLLGKSPTLRWNDAKVAPTGSLWAGTMASDSTLQAGSLFCIFDDGKQMKEVIKDVSISNGLDWSPDGKKFYFVDTMKFRLDSFDFENDLVSNHKILCEFDKDKDGYPDGLTIDAEGCIWLAFWNGGVVKRISPQGEVLENLVMPVSGPTSCTFVGSNLNLLIITTAKNEDSEPEGAKSGMTFCVETTVPGKLNYLLNY